MNHVQRTDDHIYNMGYYLLDGVHPSWSSFLKTVTNTQEDIDLFFFL